MRHSMYRADRQTPLAYRSSLPNGYESVNIKILEWIRRVSQQTDSAAAATHRRAS
jgi:ribosomal protein L32E